MSEFRSIGVALDGSAMALRGLSLGIWLSSRLGARVHVLNAGAPGPPDEALTRLGVPRKYWPALDFRQLGGDAAAAIIEAEQALSLDLIVMSARGVSGERKRGASSDREEGVPSEREEGAASAQEEDASSEPEAAAPPVIGHVARDVVQQSAAPILLLPPRYEEDLPWRSALVPLSGELGPDDALTLALRLATALDLSVTVAHVMADGERSAALVDRPYADELHHEYAGRLNELIDRACPLCSAADRARIEEFVLGHGDVAAELMAVAEQRCRSVIVVGWYGKLVSGHAHVVKALLERVTCPLLLVKAVPRELFRLKVGESMRTSD
jgi:nucleotide-binding universal stress UspA family protein